jgi:hypothetical protein
MRSYNRLEFDDPRLGLAPYIGAMPVVVALSLCVTGIKGKTELTNRRQS